jgi:hypothetical protein
MVLWIWYSTGGQDVQVESVIDSENNMGYSRAVGPTAGAGVPGFQQEIWYGFVAMSGAGFSVTANFSAVFTGDKAITGHEFTGADPTGSLQFTAANNGATGTANCGPVQATQGGLVFAAAIFPGGATAGAGFTQVSGLTGNVSEYEIATAAGEAMGTFTNTPQGWIAQMATFK